MVTCILRSQASSSLRTELQQVMPADDGYSRRGNIGGSLVRNMALTYTPHMAPMSVVQELFEGIRFGVGVESRKIVFLYRGHLLFTCSHIFAVGCIVCPQCTDEQTDRRTDRQTDRQTDRHHHANSRSLLCSTIG